MKDKTFKEEHLRMKVSRFRNFSEIRESLFPQNICWEVVKPKSLKMQTREYRSTLSYMFLGKAVLKNAANL